MTFAKGPNCVIIDFYLYYCFIYLISTVSFSMKLFSVLFIVICCFRKCTFCIVFVFEFMTFCNVLIFLFHLIFYAYFMFLMISACSLYNYQWTYSPFLFSSSLSIFIIIMSIYFWKQNIYIVFLHPHSFLYFSLTFTIVYIFDAYH